MKHGGSRPRQRPDDQRGGARPRSGPKRRSFKLDKAAAQLLDAHATDNDADTLLTQLVLTADDALWQAVKDTLAEPPALRDEPPIIV